MPNDDKGDVLLILDLRYTDLELFESTRAAFVSSVEEMLSVHSAAEVLGGGAVGRVDVFAASASGVFPVTPSDSAGDALHGLLSLAPVRRPPRDSDQSIISAVQKLFVSAERRRCLLFVTTFTAIGDFFRLAQAPSLLAVSFMESAWISLHVDATALATTSLSLTPSVRAVRSPAAPARVRGSLQRALSPVLRLQPRVAVSLRIGRYAIPCVAQRPFLSLPARCCAAADLSPPADLLPPADLSALVIGRGAAAASAFERERTAARAATLRAEGIVPASAVGEDELYGDGWALLPREAADSGDGDGRAPEEWVRHVAEELRDDALVLTSQQPLLDPPHQLALPHASFVAFVLAPGQLYMRCVVPPELRAERVDSDTGAPARRLDAAVVEEMRDTAKALREVGGAALAKHAGVARMTAQLRREDSYAVHLEKRQQPQAKRKFHQSLHSNRF